MRNALGGFCTFMGLFGLLASLTVIPGVFGPDQAGGIGGDFFNSIRFTRCWFLFKKG